MKNAQQFNKMMFSDASEFEISIPEIAKGDPNELLAIKFVALTLCVDFAYFEGSGSENRGIFGYFD